MSVKEAAFKLAYKRLCQPFLDKLEDPGAAQEACLRKVLNRCKDTLYGKEYGFSDIKSVEEFQSKVPITTIESMQPYIARCMKGEQNILFPDKIVYFLASSGTTGVRKYFPLGEYRVGEYARESARWGLFYIVHGDHYDLLDGATIVIHAPPSIGIRFGSYDVASASGAFTTALSSRMQSLRGQRIGDGGLTVPPPEVNAISDWDLKVYLTARYAVAADVRMSVGITALIVSLLRKIRFQFYDRLLADPELDIETKTRLRRASKDGVINIRELWPNFTIFGAGGLSITPYRRIIHDLLGDIEIWDVYGAAEGTIGAQIYPDGGIVPAVDRTFFEFQPEREGAEPIPLSDVKINTPYRVLMTNHQGFYRYELGDLITFAALNPPEFGEITRMKTVLNVVGERMREELLLRALDYACERQGTSFVECALLPEVTINFTRYQLFVEFTQVPSDLEEFACDLDSHLMKASKRFEYYRKSSTLSPTLIIPVSPGGFDTFLLEMGKNPGTSKVPRILTPELSRLIPQLARSS